MRQFDPNAYPPVIAQWIICRGSDLPPLQWQQRVNRLGAQQLCKIKPGQLLGDSEPSPGNSGSNILAGMLLWNGLVTVTEAICRQLQDTEAKYWQALAVRHQARPEDAKALLQQVGQHTIHSELAQQSAEIIGLGTESSLGRFGNIIKQQGTWEPHAFVDLYESARLEQTPKATETVVCQIQRVEFYLLLEHCMSLVNCQPAGAAGTA